MTHNHEQRERGESPNVDKMDKPIRASAARSKASKNNLSKTEVKHSGSSKKKWGAEEREFLPAALEVIETPANPVGRGLAISLSIFFTIALLWAIFGSVDVVVVARGKLAPVGGVKIIQPIEVGIVREILVRDGQHVAAGDLLIGLDPTDSEVDKKQMQRQRENALIDLARLKAQYRTHNGEPTEFVAPQEVDRDAAHMAAQQLESDILSFKAGVATIDKQHSRLEAEYAAIQTEIQKLNDTLPIIEERENALHKLFLKGISPKPVWLEAKTLMIETRSDLEIQKYRLNQTDAGMAALDLEKRRTKADALQQILDDLQKAQDQLNAAELALRKAEKREKHNSLRAPVSGTVQQLSVHTLGGVVTPAEPLMTIVPDDALLEVEANVLNKDAGFVFKDQVAEIKVDSFPYTKYGTLHGKVNRLSRDTIQDESLGLVYLGNISLSTNEILADGRFVPLSPGMLVSVEIKTGKRRIIDFLLSPLQRYKDESFRER